MLGTGRDNRRGDAGDRHRGRGIGGAPVTQPAFPAPPTAPTQLHLTLSPRTVKAGDPTRMRFRVTGESGKGVGGARIRIGRTHIRTDSSGRATATVVVHHRGVKRATVRSNGFRPAHATFRAT